MWAEGRNGSARSGWPGGLMAAGAGPVFPPIPLPLHFAPSPLTIGEMNPPHPALLPARSVFSLHRHRGNFPCRPQVSILPKDKNVECSCGVHSPPPLVPTYGQEPPRPPGPAPPASVRGDAGGMLCPSLLFRSKLRAAFEQLHFIISYN